MAVNVAAISDTALNRIVLQIEGQGYASIPDYIDPVTLRRMREFVASAITQTAGQYAVFNGPLAVRGSGLDELPQSLEFKDLIQRIYQKSTGLSNPTRECYQVLRCLIGSTAEKHSYNFHYDTYVVTVLIPIEIPTSGRAGDLLMIPNTRRIRKTYLQNVFDKILLDNPVTQFVLRLSLKWLAIRFTRIKMIPGTAYIFWGYRSIHTNEPCDSDRVRATALFHYYNPHEQVT